MTPPDVPLFPSDTVVTQLQNTSARLSSIPNPVSASSGRESDVQTGESSLTPGSIQISPRELIERGYLSPTVSCPVSSYSSMKQ